LGVGIIDSHSPRNRAMRNLNLRRVFDDFCQVNATAREIVAGGTLVGDLKGAPLRSSLRGARFAKPGVLVTGEAAGSTYSFTGEGIGKALETGILAADALIAARERQLDDAAVQSLYESSMDRLRPKFELYEKGNRVNHHPWLTELLIRRAARSPRLLQRMARVLEEKSTPDQLLTLRGLYKVFVE
jgi:flavin-dependent dehydrogenase